jgi:plasmid stabilization system protein ParE
MAYKVIVMPPAKRRLEQYVRYTLEELNNRQAAKAILDDAKETKARLSYLAATLKICDNPTLAMIYRIDGDTVIVDGMFHEMQDYEGVFVNEMKLK